MNLLQATIQLIRVRIQTQVYPIAKSSVSIKQLWLQPIANKLFKPNRAPLFLQNLTSLLLTK